MAKKIYDILLQLLQITVGVFVALAVDNYRESIQEHKLEKEYLINLRNSVQADTVVLKNEIQNIYRKINSISELFELAKTSKTVREDKFDSLITNARMLIRANLITAVYDELRFTGNFKLIRNNDLKLLIINYYNNISILKEENNREGYSKIVLDNLTYDELEYKTPFDQKRILTELKTNQALRTELQRTQKLTSTIRTAMIYSGLPRSIELLEKLQAEIDK